jgi:lipoprotein-anchoring transpeptidase ErfK/SrfK
VKLVKLFRALLIGLLFVLGLSLPFSARASNAIQADALATTTTQLNLRAGPATTTAVRRAIPAGAHVVITEGPFNGAWYAASFAGVSGFVHGGYLEQRAATARLSEVTATANLTLREGPSTTAPAIGVLPSGSRVTISPKPAAEGWRQVTFGELTGYVLSNSFTRTFGAGGAKRIIVDISDQWLYAMEGNDVVLTVPVTTGRDTFNTPVGKHRIQWKAALRTMKGTSNGETWEVPDVPHAMYITTSGVALHGAYWHRLFGSGVRLSHGCINLPLDAAALLYDWAPVGTLVEVQD